MQPFLKFLTSYLNDKYGNELGEYCLLFPNRRSGLFFKNYLKEIKAEAYWIPEIYTINNFMEHLSDFQPADPLEISFMIYEIYRQKIRDPEDYDEFYFWGEMMLRDFDDIDKYLINAKDIFSNVSDLKEIENHFDYLSSEQKKVISRFWKYFDKTDISFQKKSFLSIWKLLFPVYADLRRELSEKKIAYEGMIYRNVAEKVTSENYPDIPWDKIIIAGFNALNSSEKILFTHLMKTGKADFYWDYDKSYVNDINHEAGRFLRENLLKYPQDPDFHAETEGLSKNKNIRIFDLPSDVLQTKQLYQILQQRDPSELEAFTDTAIILSDESLLQPVLSSLPTEVPSLNITMGYPLSGTPVYSFVEGLLQMQKNLAVKKRKDVFYYRDVLSILNHQYIKSFFDAEAQQLINVINNQNKIYLYPGFFSDNSLFEMIFRKVETAVEMPVYISDILNRISSLIVKDENDESAYFLEKEYIFQILTRLNKLKELFSEEPVDQSIESFGRLFRKILANLRIPFEGEPLHGLQIMGVLESRLLDFKNLVFLSLNEGVMPARHSSFSFIPVNLRFAFGLPTYEEHDAIYAYYFFRLLQRAGNVSILYNSKTEGLNTGEPGRYVHQLKYLYDYHLEQKTVSFRISQKKAVKILIKKTPAVVQKLKEFRPGGSMYLSPSAVTVYLDCPLKFYLTYVAGIKEEDEVSEEIDAPGFGNLFHHTLENLYSEYEGEFITEEIINKISDPENIRRKLDDAFRKEFLKSENDRREIKPEGKNIIIYEMIKKLVSQTLQQDKKINGFKFVKAEEKIYHIISDPEIGFDIKAGGKIDRIDEREGRKHLIDYKTGKVSTKFKNLESLFDRDSWSNSDNLKGIFQVLMYCWIYAGANNQQKTVPLIYSTNRLFSDDFLSNIEIKSDGMLNDYSLYHSDFDEKIMELIREIFNPDISFSQTDDEHRCRFCVYADICHRNK